MTVYGRISRVHVRLMFMSLNAATSHVDLYTKSSCKDVSAYFVLDTGNRLLMDFGLGWLAVGGHSIIMKIRELRRSDRAAAVYPMLRLCRIPSVLSKSAELGGREREVWILRRKLTSSRSLSAW